MKNKTFNGLIGGIPRNKKNTSNSRRASTGGFGRGLGKKFDRHLIPLSLNGRFKNAPKSWRYCNRHAPLRRNASSNPRHYDAMSKQCHFKKGSTYCSSLGNIKIQVCKKTKHTALTISRKGCYTEQEPLHFGLSNKGRKDLTVLLNKTNAFLNE